MRPVRLDLEGFAGFRDATTVDFTDADYFALVGPTGSGKSTVIDAMTFALYGSAPRWGSVTSIQYALAPTANRCTIRLVFDVASQRYVIAREIRRVGQSILQRNCVLERFANPNAPADAAAEAATEPVAAGPAAVREQVVELLGLEFEDFCTCVVLPQGDFATFLKAKTADRQKILLKLLGAGIYGEIGRKAGQRATESEARAKLLTEQVVGLSDATPQAEAAAQTRVDNLALLLATSAEELSGLRKLLTGLVQASNAVDSVTVEIARLEQVAIPTDVETLQTALSAAQDRYLTAARLEREAATAAAAAAEAVRTGPDRGTLEQALRWHRDQADHRSELAPAQAAVQTITDQLTATQAAAQRASVDLESARDVRDRSQRAQVSAAAAMEAVSDKLRLVSEVKPPIGVAELADSQAEATARRAAAQDAFSEAEAELAKAQQQRGQLPERSALAATRRALADYRQAIAAAEQARTAAELATQALTVEIASHQAAITQHGQAQSELETARAQAAAADLRPHLQTGEPCPVCDQRVESLPDPMPAPELTAARERLDQARADLDQAARRWQACTATANRTSALAATREEGLTGLDRQLSELLPGQPSGANRAPAADQAELDRLQSELEAAIAAETAAGAEARQQRQLVQATVARQAELAAQSREHWAALNALTGRLAALGAPSVTTDELATAWQEITVWAAETTRELRQNSLPAARSTLVQADAKLLSSEQELTEASRSSQAATERLTAATGNASAAKTRLTALTEQLDRLTELLRDQPTEPEANRLLVECRELETAAAVRRDVAQDAARERAAAELTRDQLAGSQAEARAELHRVRDPLVGLGAPAIADQDLAKAWSSLAGWATQLAADKQAELTNRRADLVGNSQALGSGVDQLTTAISDHEIDLTAHGVHLDLAAGPRFAALTAQLDLPDDMALAVGRLPSQADGTQLREAIERLGAELQRVTTVIAVEHQKSVNQLADTLSRRQRAAELGRELAAETEAQQVAAELQTLMRSNRFPQWLADAALDLLVADASESLLRLSGGQFSLTHEKGEFFVLDHADADSRRSVRTLSGGETFQASLALALALSEHLATLAAGGRTRLDSIFLDEGFGTLDPDALEVVAGTLETLAQDDRMVGVITHVAGLADRIPVRFEVSRNSRTSQIVRVGS